MLNKMEKKILIVDDDERNIFALNAVLISNKYNCISSSGGLEALELLQECKNISIALVDMMMPGMDGYELIGLIKSIPSLAHISIVAVTAQAMPGDKEKCLAAGADNYISKPVNVDILLKILNEYSNQQQW